MDNMDMTPEDVRDMKMRRRAGQAYDRAMINTPAAPMPPASAARPKRPPMVEEAIQEMEDEKARKKIRGMGYKNGGKVSSASKRADGCAQRGKTRGKMI
jgi:hypothetical protein